MFKFNVESHIRSLQTLSIKMENYGALISTLVLEKLPDKIQDGKNGAIFDLLHTFFFTSKPSC